MERAKKSKIPFVIAGGIILLAAFAALLLFTDIFGTKINGVRLDDEKDNALKVGGLCYFREQEKQSVPYRWEYYISDESLMSVYSSEYEDDSGPGPIPDGGDKGWRTIHFEALASGVCVITLRYEDIRDENIYHSECIYTVVISD